MKIKLVIIFLLIVLLPLGILFWFSFRIARYEQREVQESFLKVLTGPMRAVDQTISTFVEERERRISLLLDGLDRSVDSLRMASLKEPYISQVFYVNSIGVIIYPSPNDTLSESEWDFLGRTGNIISDPNVFTTSVGDFSGVIKKDQSKSKQAFQQSADSFRLTTRKQNVKQASVSRQGWFTWFWSQGIQLLFWQQEPSGNVIGVELDRVRFLSDLIARLPNTEPSYKESFEGRIRLTNSKGESIYQWGQYEPGPEQKPYTSMSVSIPLATWNIEYYYPLEKIERLSGKRLRLSMLMGMAALGIVVLGLAFYFYFEHTREIRDAEQRVTFVNQVSHELKTPLTNIRMYAELLENRYEDEDPKTKKYLKVIVSESQRLSRLIGNILSFGRHQKDKLTLRLKSGVIDHVVRSVMEMFKVSFEQKNIAVSFDSQAQKTVEFDHDVLEQILGNLINNVEKYAASGGVLNIKVRQSMTETILTISDQGPGIPMKDREKIFLPFTRISNKLTNGVSGTGIGLTIARELARLHGGDLVLVPTRQGATFEVRLSTPQTQSGGEYEDSDC